MVLKFGLSKLVR